MRCLDDANAPSKDALMFTRAEIVSRSGIKKEGTGRKSVDELLKSDIGDSKSSGSSEKDNISEKLAGSTGAILESIQKAFEKAIELKVSLINVR